MRSGLLALAVLASPLLLAGACNKDDGSNLPEATRSCEGMCGHGTKCVGDTCVIDWGQGVCVKPEDAVCDAPDSPAWTECPFAAAALPTFRPVYDKKIPRFNPKQTRVQSFVGGTERVDDYGLEEEMEKLMVELESCLAIAACYHGGDPGPGEIDFTFRLMPDGSVSQVSVKADGPYKKWGVEPCARKVVYEHQFPERNGEPKGIDYTMILGSGAPEEI